MPELYEEKATHRASFTDENLNGDSTSERTPHTLSVCGGNVKAVYVHNVVSGRRIQPESPNAP